MAIMVLLTGMTPAAWRRIDLTTAGESLHPVAKVILSSSLSLSGRPIIVEHFSPKIINRSIKLSN